MPNIDSTGQWSSAGDSEAINLLSVSAAVETKFTAFHEYRWVQFKCIRPMAREEYDEKFKKMLGLTWCSYWYNLRIVRSRVAGGLLAYQERATLSLSKSNVAVPSHRVLRSHGENVILLNTGNSIDLFLKDLERLIHGTTPMSPPSLLRYLLLIQLQI